ncbi:hypothetical protein AAC387_Pa01g1264 [Persea americana]
MLMGGDDNSVHHAAVPGALPSMGNHVLAPFKQPTKSNESTAMDQSGSKRRRRKGCIRATSSSLPTPLNLTRHMYGAAIIIIILVLSHLSSLKRGG